MLLVRFKNSVRVHHGKKPALLQYADSLNLYLLMKPNRIFIIVALLILLAVVIGALFFAGRSSAPPLPSQETPTVQLKPEFVEGAFIEDQEAKGTFIQPQETIEVSLQKAKERQGIVVSWDESEVRVFHLVLLNTDFTVIWLLSALDKGDVTASISKNRALFIPSGYVLGDILEGFQLLEDQQKLELTPGQEYYLQMIGFTKDGTQIGINKKFTFTTSCLSPDCE